MSTWQIQTANGESTRVEAQSWEVDHSSGLLSLHDGGGELVLMAELGNLAYAKRLHLGSYPEVSGSLIEVTLPEGVSESSVLEVVSATVAAAGGSVRCL